MYSFNISMIYTDNIPNVHPHEAAQQQQHRMLITQVPAAGTAQTGGWTGSAAGHAALEGEAAMTLVMITRFFHGKA